MSHIRNRIRGCLLGQAIGDALGARYEFESNDIVIEHMKRDTRQNFLPILGGGPFDVYAGQITDDTELALANAHVLIDQKYPNIDRIAYEYVRWHFSHPFDEGNTVANACYHTSLTMSPETNRKQMSKNATTMNSSSLSNGSLMRISPIAIACGLCDEIDDVLRIVSADSSLTHGDQLVWYASTAYALAIGSLIKYGNKNIAYQLSCNFAHNVDPLLYRILKMAKLRPQPVECSDGQYATTDSSKAGYLGIALQNSFYELLNGTSFAQSLVNVVKRGGDTDTNGAITGALLGAYYGFQKIPPNWIETVLTSHPFERIKQYPLADTRQLVGIADQLYNIYYKDSCE